METSGAYRAARSIVESVVDCGTSFSEIPYEDDPSAGMETAEDLLHTLPPEECLEEARYAALLEALREFFSGGGREGARRTEPPLPRFASQLRDKAQLEDEERLLLRLVYQDGLSVTAAGKVLGYTAAQTHGKLRRLLARLCRVLEEADANPL